MKLFKNLFLVLVAMVIVVGVAGSAAAQVYAGNEQQIERDWRQDLREWHRSEKERARQNDAERDRIKQEWAEIEAAKQQQCVPPAGEFIPAPAPLIVAVPLPVPLWGYRYFGYYDGYESVFARIWCHRDWRAPYGWRSTGPGDRHLFRNFAEGRVDGGRVFFNSRSLRSGSMLQGRRMQYQTAAPAYGRGQRQQRNWGNR